MNRRSTLRVCLAVLSVLAAGALVVVVLPKMTHTGWRAMGDRESDLPPLRLVELTAIWAVGLYTYTFALAAALPGLRRHHALALNLSGSGVSNVLPFGGAAGMGLNYAMLHSWGYDRKRATTFTIVSQTAGALMKVSFALIGLIALIANPAAHEAVPLHARSMRVIGPGVGIAASVVLLVVLARTARWRPVVAVRSRIVDMLAHVVREMRGQWWRVLVGTYGYAVLQLVLFAACLDVAEAHLSFELAVLGFAIDRLLTLLPFTPGGVGVVEAGTSGLLIILGGDPTAVVSGVLLFRGFSYLAEIPVGGAVALGWLAWRSQRRVGVAVN